MSSAAQCFGLYAESGEIVGFLAVLHQPHGVSKKIKRVTRLVILPDYQGVGIGRKFVNAVGDLYLAEGYRFHIVTSAKNMIAALRKDPSWSLRAYEASQCNSSKSSIDCKRKTMRNNCKVARFAKTKLSQV